MSDQRVAAEYLIRTRLHKKEGPDIMQFKAKVYVFRPVWGTFTTGLGYQTQEYVTSDRHFAKRRPAHKKAEVQRQQSRRRWTGSFAFVPHTYRFLGRQSLGVEPRTRLSRAFLRGTLSPTKKHTLSANALKRPFCGYVLWRTDKLTGRLRLPLPTPTNQSHCTEAGGEQWECGGDLKEFGLDIDLSSRPKG